MKTYPLIFNRLMPFAATLPPPREGEVPLANWLASPFGKSGGVGMPEVQKFSGKEVFEKIRGKRGIIFFQNYYGPGNQGDHIDLWDGFRLTHIRSIAQIYLRFGPIAFGSDYEKSESV